MPEGYVPEGEHAADARVGEAPTLDSPDLAPDLDKDGFLEVVGDGAAKAVTHRVRGKRSEEPEGGVGTVDWGAG